VLLSANAITSEILSPPSSLNYGFNKTSNIYNFFSTIDFKDSLGPLDYYLSNKYNSTALRTKETALKESDDFIFNLKYSLNTNFNLLSDASAFYNSDKNSSLSNSLSRYSIIPKIEYLFDDKLSMRAGFGGEFNKKFDIVGEGIRTLFDLTANRIDLDDIKFNAKTSYSRTDYKDGRKNYDAYAKAISTSYSDNGDKIGIEFAYTGGLKDFLNIYDSKASKFLIENNYDNLYDAKLVFDYKPALFLSFNGGLSYQSQRRSRKYDSFNELIPSSAFSKESFYNLISFELNASTTINHFENKIGLAYENKDENFKMNRNFGESELSDNSQIQTYSLNNYSSNKIRLSDNFILSLSNSDKISLSAYISIYRYDTPTKENNDDRDELYSSIYLKYEKQLNSRLSFKLGGEYRNSHLVYLKAEKSSQNYTLRTLSFNPGIKFVGAYFSFSPEIEILTNYHVYDYNLSNESPATYSFRQIGYKDSICAPLGDNIFVNILTTIRYGERGILNWSKFTEKPTLRTIEQNYKFLIYNKFGANSFGFGARIYKNEQRPLTNSGSGGLNYSLFTVSPEVKLSLIFSSRYALYIDGWYDFQKINSSKRETPNLILKAEISL
jgi:hypothetical protein